MDKVGIASSRFAALLLSWISDLVDDLVCNRAQLSDQRCVRSAASLFFIFVTFNKILADISVAGLVIASIINVLFSHSLRSLAHD